MTIFKNGSGRVGLLTAATILAAALVSAPSAAEAQRPKYTRQTQVKVNVKQSDRTRPLVPKEDQGPAVPEFTADEVLEIEGAKKEIQDAVIQELEMLIDDTPDSEVEEKADLLFRLAELHAQQQRYHRLKSQEYTLKSDTAKKAADKKKWKTESEKSAKKSKESLLSAVKAYKRIADNDKYKNYGNMDKVLFYYGFTLQQGKYNKEARNVYDRLKNDYPDSPFIPEVYVVFGDYYFEQAGVEPENFKDHLGNAAQNYKKTLEYPKSSVYTYALYKMGWVYLNLGKHQIALETFFKVADLTKGDKKKEPLNRAAKKDIVRAYAEVGDAEKAHNFFKRVDKGYAFEMYQLLGDIYIEQGKAAKAIFTFRDLMKVDAKHKNVCLWQYNVAHAMMTEGNNKQKVDEIENLVKLYGAYKDKKILPAAELEECHDNAAAMAGDLARAYHNESMKTLNPETLAYADRLYHVYLEVFPDAEDYGETQYYYAELLWSRAENEKNQRLQTELWENAAIEFTNVVKNGKVDGKILKEAAYAAVLGWKNALAVDPRVKAPPIDTSGKEEKIPEPQPIPERELKMLDAFDVYIKYIKDPKDDELVGMKFLKANIYRRYNHFDKAQPIFEDIIKNHKEHETAEYSVNLLLDALNKWQKYDEMIKWVDILIEDKKFLEGKDDLAERLGILKNQSLRKAAEKCETNAKEKGDYALYVDCGQMYIEIFNRNVEADDADILLYNAGVNFEQGKSIGAAIQMFEALSQAFPKSVHTQKAIARLGKNYAAIAWYRESAQKLEEYAKRFAGEKDAYDAMNDAVFYRKGIGDDEKAIENTNYFIKTFGGKKPAEAASAYFSLTSIYEKQGDKDKVVSHLRAYLKKYGEKGGADRAIVAWAKIGEILWDQSCKAKTVNGSCIRVVRERAIRSSSKGKKKRKKGSDQPTQCGPEAKIKLTVVARDEKLVKDAMKAFNTAISAFEKLGGKTGGDDRVARYYYALAKFHKADVDYETFLSYKFPANLDFNPNNESVAKKSMKRFEEWITNKAKAGEAARKKYEDLIFNVKDAQNAIAAAARIGQIQQNFSDALFTAEIPSNVRTGAYADEGVEAYCDALMEKAEPLEAKSLEAFGVCLKVSTDLGWFSEWSKLCEKELGQIRPEEYPTASELRAQPDKVAPMTTVEKAVTKLP